MQWDIHTVPKYTVLGTFIQCFPGSVLSDSVTVCDIYEQNSRYSDSVVSVLMNIQIKEDGKSRKNRAI